MGKHKSKSHENRSAEKKAQKKPDPKGAAGKDAPKTAAGQDKVGLLQRLFKIRKKESAESASREQRSQLNKKLSGEISRIKKSKDAKARKAGGVGKRINKHIFTIRGFIRAVDLPSTFEKAGLYNDPKEVSHQMLRANIILLAIATLYFIIDGIIKQADPFRLIMFIVAGWVTGFFLSLGLLWLCYLFYLDMKIYQRTKEVEKVFPDFLQLASSNISAGMPIDRALWYAVRPNFGVLAKEIETVAKNTMAGQDLSSALEDFSKKYESKVIMRSVSLILEGLAAGGQLADLLNKIALNIEETRILKRDMAANVTTYVIFISFATIVAAPVLLGLSTELLSIISRITSTLLTETSSSSVGMFSFSFSSDSVSVDNFKIFAMIMLAISSVSAACIVNIIQKGRVKDGLGKIPIFIAIALVLYFISSAFIGSFFTTLI